MKFISLSSLIYQILCFANPEPGFINWRSSCYFLLVAGLVTPPAVLPAVPPTTPAAPPAPSPDVFATTTDPTLTVFYDAMEECSQQFFNTTYINQCTGLCSRIKITLVPCQKAKDQSGELACSTPGDPTCKLNKMHSCAISLIPDQTQLMNYLACTMKGPNLLPDPTALAACATLNKVNDAAIQQCATSCQGKDLCKAYSDRVMEDMNTIPGFIFKKPEDIKPTDLFQYMDYYRSHICYNNVRFAVCSQLKAIKAPTPPPECDQKLILGVFYKAMDEKTQKWFHELGTVYDTFSPSIIYKYQPCMYAELSADGKLDCQDPNDKDCLVGKHHACAIWLVNDPKTLYQFLNCTMQDPKTMPDFEKCATDYKIPYEPIKTCATTDRGKGLCYDSSKSRPKTVEVSIPLFSFELTFDEALSKKTADATDLQPVLCDQLKKYGIVHPTVCTPATPAPAPACSTPAG